MAIFLIILGILTCLLALWLARAEQRRQVQRDTAMVVSIHETGTLYNAIIVNGEIVECEKRA